VSSCLRTVSVAVHLKDGGTVYAWGGIHGDQLPPLDHHGNLPRTRYTSLALTPGEDHDDALIGPKAPRRPTARGRAGRQPALS
jgi:hypothetical protein